MPIIDNALIFIQKHPAFKFIVSGKSTPRGINAETQGHIIMRLAAMTALP
nr:hypothetical protein [Asticcacaulis excentricus]